MRFGGDGIYNYLFTPYGAIFATVAVFAIINIFLRRNVVLYALLTASFIVLTLFAGLRRDVGYDYQNYAFVYNAIVNWQGSWNIELLVSKLMILCSFLGIGYTGFLFVMAFMSVGSKHYLVAKYCEMPLFGLLIYLSKIYLSSDFGQIRQGLALSLTLLAFIYAYKQNFLKYLFILGIAFFIHSSSIIFFPAYFIARLRVKNVWYVVGIIFSIFAMSSSLFAKYILLLSSFLPAIMSQKLDIYSQVEANTELGFTASYILRMVLVLACLFLFRKNVFRDEYGRSVFNVYYLSILFYSIFNSMPQLGGRGSLYFQFLEILLIPLLIYRMKEIIPKILISVFAIVYCYVGYVNVLQTQPDTFLPYRFIW